MNPSDYLRSDQPQKGASATMTTTHPDTTATEDRLAILEVIGNLALLLEARDWNALEGLFSNPVCYDRTSLFGGDPQTLSPPESLADTARHWGISTLSTT
jgi:hypothetical protein